MFPSALIVLFIFMCYVEISLLKELGEECMLNDKTAGYCTYQQYCSTISGNSQYIIKSNLCGINKSKIIVCCPIRKAKSIIRKKNTNKSAKKCLENFKRTFLKRNVRSILGGFRALPGEFAHMAALGYSVNNKTSWKCGGTLISDQYVLTAAHCFKTRDAGIVKFVRLGDLVLDSEEDLAAPQTFNIEKLIPYPKFHRRGFRHDIGLIKLNKAVKFNLHVFPACLYTKKSIANDKLTAIGWGPLKVGTNNSNSLMKTKLDVFTNNKCRIHYFKQHNYNISSDRQFCAAGTNDKSVTDTCPGASGGPLLSRSFYNKQMHYAVGIVSFGPKCGMNEPGIYTKIPYYISWIESIVWP